MSIRSFFYEDPDLAESLPNSIFLAGPTIRGSRLTPWRREAAALLAARGFDGTIVIPEFRGAETRSLTDLIESRFVSPPSPSPDICASTYNILRWETLGIENSALVLFWMPFTDDRTTPESFRPGYTTRAEVGRETARNPGRVVLGMPRVVMSAGHIRYHAFHAGLHIYETLEETVVAALRRLP